MATTPLKGRARQGAERRAAVVDAALDVFALKGFRSGALAEVGERVGLSAAGVLYHFGSKAALLLAVIAERDRRLGPAVDELSAVGGLEAIRRLVRFAEISEAEPGLTALHTVLQLESLEVSHPAHHYFHRRSRLLRQWTTDVLLAAQRAGEIRVAVDCAAKADELIAYLEGAAVLWLVDRSLSLADLYRSYLDSFVGSLSS